MAVKQIGIPCAQTEQSAAAEETGPGLALLIQDERCPPG
jgi:hypothetical protein